jgi:hypothetical protein
VSEKNFRPISKPEQALRLIETTIMAELQEASNEFMKSL